MAKRIVVLSDGTGNSSAKAEKTNVWRMFQAIDQSLGEQLAMYDDGVGTSSNKYLAALGGALGWGLKRNVLDLYKFICRTYEPDADLFGFGFSRGAFTIRTLIDFIVKEGLVEYRSEEELDRNARRAYRHFRSACFSPALPWYSPVGFFRRLGHRYSGLLDRVFDRAPLAKRIAGDDMRVRFIGVWDTVSAYGMPVEEFKPVVNFLFWPMMWDNLRLSPQVERACHALALDDERTTFHPVVWDERLEEQLIAEKRVAPDRLSQVWFAGVHSNLGGGYPEDQLPLVSLDWMMSQAVAAGLALLPDHMARVSAEKSAYARIYDSRAGFNGLYRYSPRVIKTYEDSGNPIWPVIHHSVLMRMAYGADRYVPLPLPTQFLVLAPDGQLVPCPVHAEMSTPREGPQQAQILQKGGVDARMARLTEAIDRIGAPDREALHLVHDTVWWRRIAYFCTMGFTLALASLPWSAPLFTALDTMGTVKVNAAAASVLGSLIDLLDPLIPAFAHMWTATFKALPFPTVLLATGLGGSLVMGARLRGRITDLGQYAWRFGTGMRHVEWMRHRWAARSRIGTVALAIALAFMVWGIGGWMQTSGNAQAGYRRLAIFAGLAALISCFVWLQARAVSARIRCGATLPATLALSLARSLRGSPALVAAYRCWSRKVVPFILGAALVTTILCLANKMLIEAQAVNNSDCHAPVATAPPPVNAQDIPVSSFCGATGIWLRKGMRYRITLQDLEGKLFDRTVHADLGGFAGASTVHRFAKPLRRWWNENWFTPVARVGQLGKEEYALHPAAPYPDLHRLYPVRPAAKDNKYWCDLGRKGPHCGPFDKPDPTDVDAWAALAPTPQERRELIAEITPQQDGELFLYVNDASLPLIGLGRNFYANNHGAIRVSAQQLPPAPRFDAK